MHLCNSNLKTGKGFLDTDVAAQTDYKMHHECISIKSSASILDAFSADFQRIEEVLEQHFSSHIPFVNEISRHILFANGKRIRPLLTVCSARLCGLDADYAFDLSAVPEDLHAASLLHDDVVDAGEMRRGVPPAYKVWGNSPAVLVGDYLYAKAIGLASQFGNVAIAAEIANTVGLMAEGEIIQLAGLLIVINNQTGTIYHRCFSKPNGGNSSMRSSPSFGSK